ncbi:DUF924 family protein [Undibacterium arcticum]
MCSWRRSSAGSSTCRSSTPKTARCSSRRSRCFTALHGHTEQDDQFAGPLDYAIRHRDVVQRFGRFPHRNAVLGRVSTPEEDAFLRLPGSGFFS